MKCPMCGTIDEHDSLYCPHCGFKKNLAAEQPLPNWRRLPGFRSRTPWKMVIAAIIYIGVLIAILASVFYI